MQIRQGLRRPLPRQCAPSFAALQQLVECAAEPFILHQTEWLNCDAALYAEYKAATPSKFLNIESTAAYGLDGTKLSAAKESKERTEAQKKVVAADQAGDRATLKADAWIPSTMALIYLLLFFYFKAIGGYRPLTLEEEKA